MSALFGDSAAQTDLVDMAKKPAVADPKPKRAGKGNEPQEALSVRRKRVKLTGTELLEEGGSPPGKRHSVSTQEARGAKEDNSTDGGEVHSNLVDLARAAPKPKAGEQFSVRRDPQGRFAPTFFSAVLRAIETAKLTKASGAQWLGYLRNQQGVKPEEMAWLGLEEWYRGQNSGVTREALAEFVSANQVEVKEVEKGEVARPVINDYRAALQSAEADGDDARAHTLRAKSLEWNENQSAIHQPSSANTKSPAARTIASCC